jgi:Fic-DOC domain mobile mystery protein B
MTPDDGNTPLSPEEEADLIPNLATKGELNEWERTNILIAYDWALNSRAAKGNDPISETYLRDLHRRMFDQTWKWAGRYRDTEKSLGVLPWQIRELIGGLLGDARFWIENKTFDLDEIAIRFHHRLVWIHPFPNGNGRHARLMADVIAKRLGGPIFTWGGADIAKSGDIRKEYIEALQAADKGELRSLLEFARS